MIREFFLPLNRPLILVGDFNEPPDDPVYGEFIHADSPFHGYLEAGASGGARGHHPARVRWPAVGQPYRLDSDDAAFFGPAGGHSHG